MNSAILNSALPKITDGTVAGGWLSITHFSLAWVSDQERSENPVSPSMLELVRQPYTGYTEYNPVGTGIRYMVLGTAGSGTYYGLSDGSNIFAYSTSGTGTKYTLDKIYFVISTTSSTPAVTGYSTAVKKYDIVESPWSSGTKYQKSTAGGFITYTPWVSGTEYQLALTVNNSTGAYYATLTGFTTQYTAYKFASIVANGGGAYYENISGNERIYSTLGGGSRYNLNTPTVVNDNSGLPLYENTIDSTNYPKGDIIYNVWQTPFPHNKYHGQFSDLLQSYASYFQYEYAECDSQNVLKTNEHSYPTSAGWPSELTSNGFPYGFNYLGSTNTSPTVGTKGDLSVANMPYYLQYTENGDNATLRNLETTSKLFPIKAFTIIETTDDSQTVVNFNLDLPALASNINDSIQKYIDAIGNFKFNRIGLYITATNNVTPLDGSNNETQIIGAANVEPVLFAVIDLGSGANCTGTNVNLDVYKTRSDEGFAGWSMDAQLPISNKNNIVQTKPVFYMEANRSDATQAYENQLISNANTTETIMQMQMMILQLANTLENYTGVNPIAKQYPGFQQFGTLNPNSEYFIGQASQAQKYFFDASLFRGVNSESNFLINQYNAAIDLMQHTDTNVLTDGKTVKVFISNLDGSYFVKSNIDIAMWNGSILFVNNLNGVRSKIFELNTNTIKGILHAKVCLEFAYSKLNNIWVLSSMSVINESHLYPDSANQMVTTLTIEQVAKMVDDEKTRAMAQEKALTTTISSLSTQFVTQSQFTQTTNTINNITTMLGAVSEYPKYASYVQSAKLKVYAVKADGGTADITSVNSSIQITQTGVHTYDVSIYARFATPATSSGYPIVWKLYFTDSTTYPLLSALYADIVSNSGYVGGVAEGQGKFLPGYLNAGGYSFTINTDSSGNSWANGSADLIATTTFHFPS